MTSFCFTNENDNVELVFETILNNSFKKFLNEKLKRYFIFQINLIY